MRDLWRTNAILLAVGVALCFLTSVWERDYYYMVVAGLPFIISGLLLLYGHVKKSNNDKAKQLFVFNIWVIAYAVLYFIIKIGSQQNLYLLNIGLIIQIIIPVGIILMMDAVAVKRVIREKKAEEEEKLKAENMKRILDDIAQAEAEEAQEALTKSESGETESDSEKHADDEA